MGQHRIQRQLLKAFSFQGRQLNSREIWWLKTDGQQPVSRSIARVGYFEVDCSKGVDDYITTLEDNFKERLRQFSKGTFTRTNVGREIYDFVAMHYVRSHAFNLQIKYIVGECRRNSRLTRLQAEAEYTRLTSHQDVELFRDLVDSVARTLTHYILYPLVTTGQQLFLTSDKIIYAGKFDVGQQETFVWFPLSPSTGLRIMSERRVGQILGPIEVHRQLGQIRLAKVPEAPILRCQAPERQNTSAQFADTINGLMVLGSTELYAGSRAAIDTAFQTVEQPVGYRYKPTNGSTLP